MIIVMTLLTFCGVLLFSAPLFGGERAKSSVEPVKIVKQTNFQQVKVQKQSLSSRISFYIHQIKTLLYNWFESKEPVNDDKPNYDNQNPHNGENDDTVPIKDAGWDDRID